MITIAELNRVDATSALLTASNGRCWDVYGSNWDEMIADAKSIAYFENLEIDLFGEEMLEA
jgi:hypothetical protein